MQTIETRCCIAGGGPAGMVLGFLLARAGVDVVVLEKHADFLRDFRGDTIHPSTLEVLHELGIAEEFLKRPHQEIRQLSIEVGSETAVVGDFTHLPTHYRFLGLMPQWDFLDFIREQASRYSGFHLRMQTEAVDLIVENGAVAGVCANSPEGPLEIRAGLTIASDGRSSVLRARAGLEVLDLGAPMDVFWMRISRKPGDTAETFGHADRGSILVQINRESYWQCALVIPKGEANTIRERGIEAFRETIGSLSPFLRDRLGELRSWDDVSLLTVKVDRLRHWARRGLLCIGDAAHAMSPIGGVGINLAIQDAVAAANILGPILIERTPAESELRDVERRREFPTRATQRMQIAIQNNIIRKVLASDKDQHFRLPWPVKMLRRWPILRRIPARMVGLGFRPEHVELPE